MCYDKFKGQILLRRDKKRKYICLIAKVCKQLICKSSGLKMLIELSFYIKTFLIWRRIIFHNLLCFLSLSQKSGKSAYFCFTRAKRINLKKEKYFFYKTLDKPAAIRTSLVWFVATDFYLDKIQTFMVQLLYVTRWRLELATIF